jgi:DNA-binding NtrC family response regulator
MSQTETVFSNHSRLDHAPQNRPAEISGRHPDHAPVSLPPSMSLDDRLIQIESGLIGWALGLTGGNKTKAAAVLRIKRSTLGDRINRCRLNGYKL